MFAMATLALACAGPALAEVTGAADDLRTGWYPDEPSLTPALLSGGGFKQVFKDSLQGQIYAQPLTANGTLLVVTEDNWAYGVDPVTGAVRWEKQFGVPVDASEEPGAPVKCTDLTPHVGITGTPVIDTEHNIAYFVSTLYTKEGAEPESGWYMHAVELTSGKEVANFPVKIEGEAQNIPGVKFEPFQELQRPALLMMNGVIYAGFGSHCDHEPYEGWIVGVSTSGLLTTKWATSAHGGSIWQAGGGLVSDGSGQILFSTGNDNFEAGVFDPPEGSGLQEPPPEGKLGESVVRVEVQPTGELKTKDYFSPFNNKFLDEHDIDLGSSAPVALPSQYFGTPSVPNLLVQDGKGGNVYLLNRDNLGGRGKETNNIVEEKGPYGGVWDSAAVWPGDGGYVYIPTVAPGGSSGGSSDKLLFFKYEVEAGAPKLSLAATSPEEFAFGSGSPIVTSNGTTSGTGVLWITRCPEYSCEGAKLVAYNPVPLGKEALQVLWQAPIGIGNKFSRTVASNGHIYVGNREGVVFGFSGPELKASGESLDLGSTPVGGQLTGEATFTNTGTPLTVSAVRTPTTPFEATGLPPVGAKIQPGEAVKVHLTFKSSTLGEFNQSVGLTTEAGETKIAISGSAAAPPPTVTSIEPTSGPIAGGTTVKIKGTGFVAPATVKIGSSATSVEVVSETEITAKTAANPAGEQEVIVTDAGGPSTGGPKYTYIARPPLESTATPPESGGTARTASLLTALGGLGSLTATTEPLVSLARLQIRSPASRLGRRRHKALVSYTLSAAGTVDIAIYRRIVSHRCQRGAPTCLHYVRTTIELEVAGHAATNVIALNLGRLSAGEYRLAATPIAPSGVRGITRYIHFKAVR
jgi:outer membrane protein assembly factor BamB